MTTGRSTSGPPPENEESYALYLLAQFIFTPGFAVAQYRKAVVGLFTSRGPYGQKRLNARALFLPDREGRYT